MNRKLKLDPLLLTAKTLLGIIIAALGVACAILVFVAVVFPLTFLIPEESRAGTFADFTMADVMATSASILLMALLVALALFFFRNLWKIITSVGEGDPFVPANAKRLRDMALSIVALYPVAAAGVIAMVAMSERLDPGRPPSTFSYDIVDFTGLLTAIVLLILSRVFRTGAAMREDLEGTV